MSSSLSSRSKSFALLKVYLSYYDMLPSSGPGPAAAVSSDDACSAEDRIRLALGIAGKGSTSSSELQLMETELLK